MCARGLAQLLGPTEKVLQEYKARAVASGQTFERVIRLEAAVLGWYPPHPPLAQLLPTDQHRLTAVSHAAGGKGNHLLRLYATY